MAVVQIASVLKKWLHVDVMNLFGSSIINVSLQGSEGTFPIIPS